MQDVQHPPPHLPPPHHPPLVNAADPDHRHTGRRLRSNKSLLHHVSVGPPPEGSTGNVGSCGEKKTTAPPRTHPRRFTCQGYLLPVIWAAVGRRSCPHRRNKASLEGDGETACSQHRFLGSGAVSIELSPLPCYAFALKDTECCEKNLRCVVYEATNITNSFSCWFLSPHICTRTLKCAFHLHPPPPFFLCIIASRFPPPPL